MSKPHDPPLRAEEPPAPYPLDPKVRLLLGRISPDQAWEQVRSLVSHAIVTYPKEAEALRKEFLPETWNGFDSLQRELDNANPNMAISLIHQASPKLPLQDIESQKPLVVMRALLQAMNEAEWSAPNPRPMNG